MKLKVAEEFLDTLDDEGIEARLYENYSGRGMFGTTTFGIVVNDIDSAEEMMEILGYEFRRDNMGLDFIIY